MQGERGAGFAPGTGLDDKKFATLHILTFSQGHHLVVMQAAGNIGFITPKIKGVFDLLVLLGQKIALTIFDPGLKNNPVANRVVDHLFDGVFEIREIPD